VPPELKHLEVGDFGAAWGGIASLQLSLPAVWTAARARGHRLADVARWMAEGPATLVGLRGKGRIAVGGDADLCVVAPTRRSWSTRPGCTTATRSRPMPAAGWPAWSAAPGSAAAG
jgi:dihydroorotase-like cyclic amidohydrolase